MITEDMLTEKFDDVEITLTRSVRESNDTGWFQPIEIVIDEETGKEVELVNLKNDNQLTKPPDSEKRKYTQDEDSYIDDEGLVFMYEYPSVKMTVVIVLDVELEKFVVQGINSLWITAQKGLRTKGTKWCSENTSGVQFKASDLSKGRASLTVSDKVKKTMKGKTSSEYDDAIKALQEQRENEFGKVK